jgi:hypothetical protein
MIKSVVDKAPQITTKLVYKIWFWAALAILIIFHGVGFWGLLFSNRPNYFQELTPLNLILTNLLLFSVHRNWNITFTIFAITVMLVGFFAEVVGVHTGLLFGNYSYGAALGLKVWDVPLLIGLNWLMLVYSTGTIVHKLAIGVWLKAIVGAGLMVLLDFFLEPVAMQFDFWSWQGNYIPLSNFIGWFSLALLLQLFFHLSNVYKLNILAPYVYAVQLLFFISLYLLI